MEKLRVVSLFSGCGGMDLGLLGGFSFLGEYYHELPFEITYAIDNDKYSVEIYNNNFNHKCEINDIRELDSKNIPKHEVLIGGFPCQSFSVVAQNPPRLGYHDDRGKLFFEMVELLKVKSPRFFIAENVKGILSANKGSAFPLIIKEFESAGYYVKHNIINASFYGVPQKRERVFIIGFKRKLDYNNFKFPDPVIPKGKMAVLRDVLNWDENTDEKYYFSDKAIKGMLRVKEKMNKGRIQNLNEPCNTINSHLSKISLNGTDPVLFINGRYRRFTPREAARIQSFPENFKFDMVSENRQYRAIGNAVPPVLMWHIALALSNSITNF